MGLPRTLRQNPKNHAKEFALHPRGFREMNQGMQIFMIGAYNFIEGEK
jgi:hypothetical protein